MVDNDEWFVWCQLFSVTSNWDMSREMPTFLSSFLTVASSPKIASKSILSFTDNLSVDSVPLITGLCDQNRLDGDLDLFPLSSSDLKTDCLWSCNDTLSSLLLELLSETVLYGYSSVRRVAFLTMCRNSPWTFLPRWLNNRVTLPF